MLRISVAIALLFVVGLSCELYAQDAGQRTRELAAALDKTKYKKKEKPNVSIEFYIDIKNEPVDRSATDFGGSYEAEEGMHALSLRVDASGAASGTGYETLNDGNRRLNFSLKNASVTGALLSATKVYETGEERNFEAVFVNRTVSTGKNASTIESRDSKFGLGFIQTGRSNDGGKTSEWTSRVFLERR